MLVGGVVKFLPSSTSSSLGFAEWRLRGYGEGSDRVLLCGIVGGLVFSLQVAGRDGGIANFGDGLRFACSGSDGVLCV